MDPFPFEFNNGPIRPIFSSQVQSLSSRLIIWHVGARRWIKKGNQSKPIYEEAKRLKKFCFFIIDLFSICSFSHLFIHSFGILKVKVVI